MTLSILVSIDAKSGSVHFVSQVSVDFISQVSVHFITQLISQYLLTSHRGNRMGTDFLRCVGTGDDDMMMLDVILLHVILLHVVTSSCDTPARAT